MRRVLALVGVLLLLAVSVPPEPGSPRNHAWRGLWCPAHKISKSQRCAVANG